MSCPPDTRRTTAHRCHCPPGQLRRCRRGTRRVPSAVTYAVRKLEDDSTCCCSTAALSRTAYSGRRRVAAGGASPARRRGRPGAPGAARCFGLGTGPDTRGRQHRSVRALAAAAGRFPRHGAHPAQGHERSPGRHLGRAAGRTRRSRHRSHAGRPRALTSRCRVRSEPLGTVTFVFAVAPHHPLAGIPSPLPASELRRHRRSSSATPRNGWPHGRPACWAWPMY